MRLFFALPLPEGIARIQTELRQRAEQQGVVAKWPRPSGLHLTLAFLGEHPLDLLPALEVIGQEVSEACRAFTLQTAGLGGFPKATAARILWLGVAPEPALDTLSATLRGALLARHIPFDAKPFRPHITLARLPGTLDIAPLQGPPCPLGVPCEGFNLYESLSEPGGSRYQVVAAFPFTA